MNVRPNERIAALLRRKIIEGEVSPGERLPNRKALAETHGVSPTTIDNAVSWLMAEGLVRTSPRGTFVAEELHTLSAPADRVMRVQRTGSVMSSLESHRVLSAQLVTPPGYVGDLFDLTDHGQVLRRESIIGQGQRRNAVAVDWYPATLAAAVPELTDTSRVVGGALLLQIKERTGRFPTIGADKMEARTATRREASHLGVPEGSTILALVHEWSDDQGLIVYGEECLPANRVIGYEYTI